MLKAWIKFKIWLIKKLGGFTEQNYIDGSIPQGTYNHCSFEVRQIRPEIVPIKMNRHITNRDVARFRECGWDSVYADLADRIGRYIVDNKLYHEYNAERNDFEYNAERNDFDVMEFEWTVYLLNPKDMQI